MNFSGIEHYDHFEDGTVFWADITDVPKAIQKQAKAIDGKAYSADSFGMCIVYDLKDKKFDVVTDTDLDTGDSRNLYYIANDGDKHWFQADMPKAFVEQVFAACEQIVVKRETKRSITEQLKKAQKRHPGKENQTHNAPKKNAPDRER